jgi:hypothetical protein
MASNLPNPESTAVQEFIAASNFATSPAGINDRYRMALGQAASLTPTETLRLSIDDLYYKHVVINGGTIGSGAFGPAPATTLANYSIGPRQILDITRGTGHSFSADGTYSIITNLPGQVFASTCTVPFRIPNPFADLSASNLSGSNCRRAEYNADGTKVLELDFTQLTFKEWTLGGGAYIWTGFETATATKSLSGLVVQPVTSHVYNSGSNVLFSTLAGTCHVGTMSTPYDVTTLTVGAANAQPRGASYVWYGMNWNTDGTILCTMSIGGGFVYVDWYAASTPYDITTLTLQEGRDITASWDLYANGQGPFYASPNLQKITVIGSDVTNNEAIVFELLAVPDSYPAAPTYSNVVLNLDMEGANLSQVTTDNSLSAHTVTWVGGASSYISTAQSKFGSSSAYFNNVSRDHIKIAHSTDFELGSGDFTIEFYIKWAEAVAQRAIISLNDSGTNDHSWTIWSTNGNIEFFVYPTAGTATALQTATWNKADINRNEWIHVALVRTGDSLSLYQDGSFIPAGTATGLGPSFSFAPAAGAALRIGDYGSDAGTAFTLEGYIDDVRITKGQALYNKSFVVNTAAWPTS